MRGLYQRATLFRREGVSRGAPVYAEAGESFACRVEPDLRSEANARGHDAAGSVKLFAEPLNARPGDRLRLPGGATAIITRVEVFRGRGGRAHHVEVWGNIGNRD